MDGQPPPLPATESPLPAPRYHNIYDMNIRILSAERNLYTGEASAVTLPGIDGSFTVLDHHAPLIAGLRAGTVRCTRTDGTEVPGIDIAGGCVLVADNQVTVCVE